MIVRSSLAESATAPAGALHKSGTTASRGPRGRSRHSRKVHRPAALAASRTFAAGLALGVLAVAWTLFALARLLETWRVVPAGPSHELVLLGQRLSYPAANAGAIVVLALATLGVLVLAAGLSAVARELRADRRFRRAVVVCRSSGVGGACVIAGARPQAFCAGLFRPRVFLSVGALELLDGRELDVVLAHERHHANRHDPLRLACGRVLADALFFLPAVRSMVERQRALAEIGADEAAVLDTAGNRPALASAMLAFSECNDAGGGLDPERVDFLLGAPTRVRAPIALCRRRGRAVGAGSGRGARRPDGRRCADAEIAIAVGSALCRRAGKHSRGCDRARRSVPPPAFVGNKLALT
jgi:Zn-dependent protease with chaperone function